MKHKECNLKIQYPTSQRWGSSLQRGRNSQCWLSVKVRRRYWKIPILCVVGMSFQKDNVMTSNSSPLVGVQPGRTVPEVRCFTKWHKMGSQGDKGLGLWRIGRENPPWVGIFLDILWNLQTIKPFEAILSNPNYKTILMLINPCTGFGKSAYFQSYAT